MNRYKIYCTEEQTKKAFDLGAPIKMTLLEGNQLQPIQPTAEEMIGWLEEQGVFIELAKYEKQKGWAFYINCEFYLTDGNSRKETTIEAIDAALDYLTKKSKTMTKEQTTQAIKIMQEWLDGKQIESKLKEQPDREFMVASNINWNFYKFEYRVKPEPTYRPYYDADEMDAAIKEHGFTVRSKNSGQRAVVVSWTDGGIGLPNIDSFYYDYVTLLREFVWLDGSPCGVKEENI